MIKKQEMKRKVAVIGAGFSGLVSAGILADRGYDVDLYEKNAFLGGRASSMVIDGFRFDKGPSWYWMPEVYEEAFKLLGSAASEHYRLTRLDPAFRVYFGKRDYVDVPDNYQELQKVFENLEPGSSKALDLFMVEARKKYELGMNGMARMPSVSWKEFLNPSLWRSALKMDIFSSVADHVRKRFKNDKIRKIMEFPVLFLGASASRIPALYTMMNYAGMCLGTYYPEGGFGSVVEGYANAALNKGVKIHTSAEVSNIEVSGDKVVRLRMSSGGTAEPDLVLGTGDYAHLDGLFEPHLRNYEESYWEKKVFAPSSLLFFIGLDKKLNNISHHNLFFHAPFEEHINAIYTDPKWPHDPLFYVCCPSKTETSVAPEGCENLFFLMPIATDLRDDDGIRNHYFSLLISRFEEVTGENINDHIIVKKSYGLDDFKNEYHAYGGNAYGLANTLNQTALLKPSIRHKRLSNMFYAGQLTVPGPGVPPTLISGEIVANYISKNFTPNRSENESNV